MNALADRTARALAVALATSLALACVKAPPPRPDPQLGAPETFTGDPAAARSQPPGDAWWEDFGDPGLSTAVTAALASNRDLRAAAARVDAAVAEARIAGADLRPTIGIGLDAARRRQNFIGLPIPGGEDPLSTTATTLGVSLNVAWEADLWGRLRAGARAALADLQAVQSDYEGARLSLAGQTAKAWIAVAEAALQVDLARRTADSWRESCDRIERRYASGLRSPLDVRLARSSLASAEALVRQREQQLDAVRRQFATLLGRYPGNSEDRPETLPAVPGAVPGGLPADLIGRRPDLAAAERRLAAADQRWVSAKRALYPRLTLTASGGTTSAALGDLLEGDFRVWSLVAGLAQPLFQGGRLRAGVDAAEASRVGAIETYAAAALRAYAEVEAALAADGYLASRTSYLDESVTQSTRAFALAEERYERGLEEYITVLDSRRSQLNAETALLAARRARLDNRVDLYLALGGGFVRPDRDDDGTESDTDLASNRTDSTTQTER